VAGCCEHGDEPSGSMKGSTFLVRFEVLTAASMKMAVFWVVVPCSLVEIVYRLFRGGRST
jgi:hypothetical protein